MFFSCSGPSGILGSDGKQNTYRFIAGSHPVCVVVVVVVVVVFQIILSDTA